jgi:hypothetical protein
MYKSVLSPSLSLSLSLSYLDVSLQETQLPSRLREKAKKPVKTLLSVAHGRGN